jgi:hypothetical protein
VREFAIHSDKHAILSLDVGPVDLKLNTLLLTWILKSHLAAIYEKLMPFRAKLRETCGKNLQLSTCQELIGTKVGSM